jgi:phosphoglycolate phosphatase
VRCLYADLDGTLLGPGASLLHGGDGEFTLLGVRALEACARAGAEVVFYSGRGRTSLAEDARLLGCRAYIFEAGCALWLDGEVEWLTDGLLPDERTIHEQIADSGAPALLLEHYAGRLEYHDPWHLGREVSHLFRGQIDVAEADALLADEGLGYLRVVDNGAVRPAATMPQILVPRGYHLIPAGASKARAVARHMQARAYAREDCVAVGDSREDLATAEVVGAFWLVANGVTADPGIREQLARHPNARVCEEAHGAGVYEAVVRTLAESRG